jgi:hypothetical protein
MQATAPFTSMHHSVEHVDGKIGVNIERLEI